MEAYEAILARRSIRKFKKEKIPKDIIEYILKASMHAPSARNQQPWQYVVIDDPALLKEIPSFAPHAKMCPKAPLAILVCGDLKEVSSEDFWPQDCAAATQNLLLAAHSKQIGSVWTGVFPKKPIMKGFTKLLSLPEKIIPFAFIVLGYPDETIASEKRFIPKRIHYNHW